MNLKKWVLTKKVRIPLIVFTGILLATSFYALYYIYQQPATVEKKVPTYSYHHKGNFTYTAQINPNLVFKESILGPGNTIYTKLLQSLEAHFSYHYKGDKPAEMKGKYTIIASLVAKDMWNLDFILVPKKDFHQNGAIFSVDETFAIDLNFFKDYLENVNKQLGVNAREPKLIIKAIINMDAESSEGTVKEILTPEMVIPISSSSFQIDGNMTAEKEGSLFKTVQVPNQIKEKWIYCIMLSILMGLLLLLILLLTKDKLVIIDPVKKQEDEFWKKYGEQIVVTNKECFPTEVISLSSMDDIIKVADEISKPIIYQKPINPLEPPICYVFDGPTAYKYVRTEYRPISQKCNFTHLNSKNYFSKPVN